jgi:hypothetical protein
MTDSGISASEYLAIQETLFRYSLGIDRKDWELFRTCFTPDCEIRFGPGLEWDGVDDVTEAFDRIHAPLDASLHRLSNLYVESFSGDAAETVSYLNAVLFREADPDGPELHLYARYNDRLVRQGDKWVIARRQYTNIYSSGNINMLGHHPGEGRSLQTSSTPVPR